MMRIQQKNENKKNHEYLARMWREQCKTLKHEKEAFREQLKDRDKILMEIKSANTTLTNRLKEAHLDIAKLKKVQGFFMDWARKQEWELPPHIRDLLPQNKSFLRKAAFEKVPYGRSPAEYTFNLFYFLSLSESEQAKLGAKVFHEKKDERPEDFAALENVTNELHDFLFHFPDENIKMTAEYAYLASCVPRFSTDPRSDWVRLKKFALNFFPVYTRVTLRKGLGRASTERILSMSNRATRLAWHLEAERVSGTDIYGRTGNKTIQKYRIKTKYDNKKGRLELLEDELYRWEIKNYGIVNYRGDFKVTNLVMDNNPPYKNEMKGIVQILWTGTCIYDSAED